MTIATDGIFWLAVVCALCWWHGHAQRPRQRIQVSACVLVALQTLSASTGQFGECNSSIRTEWLPDGRTMRILEDYRYVEPSGKVWSAPKDSIVDGASIPQFLWSVIGGPFEGKYRNASVVHDVACQTKADDWRSVHRMFLNAMQCSGVTRVLAYGMYFAVYQCGPRWGSEQGIPVCDPVKALKGMRSYLWRLFVLVRQQPDLSINDLESLTQEQISAIDDPITALVRALQGRAEVNETDSGVNVTVTFETDETSNANAMASVEVIAATFRDLPIKMTVEGHADSVGTSEYNLALGNRRAENMLSGFVAAGFDQASVRAVSMGEERPRADNDSPEGRRRNRRATVVISAAWQ